MSLRAVVKSVTDLPKWDRFLYCQMTFHGERRTSNDQSPEWNEAFKWTLEVVPESTEVIEVDIVDHKTLHVLAKGTAPLASVLEQGSTSLDVALTSPEGNPLQAKMRVDLHYRAPLCEALKGEVSAAKARIEELEEKLREANGEVDRLNTKVAMQAGEVSKARDEIQVLEEDISRLETQASGKEHEPREQRPLFEEGCCNLL